VGLIDYLGTLFATCREYLGSVLHVVYLKLDADAEPETLDCHLVPSSGDLHCRVDSPSLDPIQRGSHEPEAAMS